MPIRQGCMLASRTSHLGPLRDGRRLGLRLVTPEGRAGFLEGAQLRELALTDARSAVISHRVLIMKEAVLDFARQHELPPPSWWADPAQASTEAASNTAVVDTASRSGAPNEKQAGPDWARPRGRSPRKLENTKNAMREEIRHSRLTIAQLQGMVEKELASKYGVSRDTARKARKSVLSESVGICRNLSNDK
jgi:hypothetical protein